tara:strand:- start:300 stop:593 length:294 start_codon:yes stop_codon:yes gene_type:complete
MEISKSRLKELQLIEEKMNALECAGVDNWEGYGIALEKIEEKQERYSKISKVVEEAMEVIQESAFEPSERGAGWASTEEAEQDATDLLINVLEELLN